MRRALVVLPLALGVGVAMHARGEEALPGQTAVLDLGRDPAAASAMPGGPGHDGRLVYALPARAPTERTVVAVPGGRPRGPSVDADGTIFVGTSTGLAIVSAEGHVVHEVPLGPLDCAPVIVPGGDVVALSRDGMAMRVTREGRVVTRVALGASVRFAPWVGDDGTLVVSMGSRTLAWLDGDLTVRAQRELPDGLSLSPTPTSRGHWAVAAGTELVFVSPASLALAGSLLLPARAATPAASAPDGTTWIATVDGDLLHVVFDARIDRTIALGTRLPDATTSDRAMLAIAPDADVLVVVPTRGLVRIAPDGAERWAWASDTPLVSSVSVDAAGRAAVIDRVGHLSVIDPQGRPAWSVALEALPMGAPIVTAQGRVVVATEHGVVILGPG